MGWGGEGTPQEAAKMLSADERGEIHQTPPASSRNHFARPSHSSEPRQMGKPLVFAGTECAFAILCEQVVLDQIRNPNLEIRNKYE
jgi:hypothetical protein